jgi:hypothetical protein
MREVEAANRAANGGPARPLQEKKTREEK